MKELVRVRTGSEGNKPQILIRDLAALRSESTMKIVHRSIMPAKVAL